ncbi:MAG TPA: helix-hairpin-helix domain-containing protein [Gemmataceae bacterium]|nr:helix-hairpin-helix domain-containing protein [Gemmataceae bacterium]
MDNRQIAQELVRYAEYLEAREANLYRVRAYRKAAETVQGLERPLADLVATAGRSGLEELPGIGSHLSYTLEELVRTGEFRVQNSEGSKIDAERLLRSVSGVGPRLARQIHAELGIASLEELEVAAHDGRLRSLGIGPKRLRGIREALAGRFARYRSAAPVRDEPNVAELLAIDQAYRSRAEAETLPTIAPRRFNPNLEPWLPIFETEQGRWHYRVLFSNTALAHRLGRTRDWVVAYFDDGISSGQRTIVTESRGDLGGRRVVRGREQECRVHYGLAHPVSRAVPCKTQSEDEDRLASLGASN